MEIETEGSWRKELAEELEGLIEIRNYAVQHIELINRLGPALKANREINIEALPPSLKDLFEKDSVTNEDILQALRTEYQATKWFADILDRMIELAWEYHMYPVLETFKEALRKWLEKKKKG